MAKQVICILVLLFTIKGQSQIIIDNNSPYDNPTFLIDSILLGGGVVATNHSFQGHPDFPQIGWFDAVNTSLGIDSGIVMSTGNIYELDPDTFFATFFPPSLVTDPDLLAVANSVPALIGDNFVVNSINDVARRL